MKQQQLQHSTSTLSGQVCHEPHERKAKEKNAPSLFQELYFNKWWAY